MRTFMAELVPSDQNARKGRQQPIRYFMLMLETIFRLQIAEHGAAGAQHIHGVGIGGNTLQHLQQRLGQSAQATQFALVRVKLLLTG